jgi:hypothetical protein
MPIIGLRPQAYRLLGHAIKADEEGRASDAYLLTAKAIEHLEDAMSVDELRRASMSASAASGEHPSKATPSAAA